MSEKPRSEPVGCLALLLSLAALVLAATATEHGRRVLSPIAPSLVSPPPAHGAASGSDPAKDLDTLREEIRLVREERMAARKERLRSVADGYTERGQRQYHRLAFENKCRYTIAVALRYRDIDDAVVTRGWWEVPAGDTMVTDAMTRDGAFWFYAENQSVGRTWDGSDDKDAVQVSVSDEKFDQIEGEPLVLLAPRTVSFAKRATGATWTDATETLECPVEEAPPKGAVAKPPSSGQGPRHP
jgi:hypothetical protein